ncbi:MAG: chromosomal replication initiator protein DnaA [Anaerotruncus sp.]|nr:chromosomal replication initiator protein DnaA [Anaerotruncus sp.]
MESFADLFALVLESCRGKMSEVAFNLWLKDISPIRLDGSVAYLRVNSEFKMNIVREKYTSILKSTFEDTLGFPVEINISCDMLSPEAPFTATSSAPVQEELDPTGNNGEYDYTFDTFIVGSSNKFAHAASVAVAANPANAYNPLFIYGASGLGKTHLLHAITADIHKNRPSYNIVYVKGDEFANGIITAIQDHTTPAFREKYRQADVLLVDDIQFIGGKESTQEEFFHTFNTLYESGKQIVLASDRPPKEIKTLEDRLRTRFEWGLLADIQTPDFETRIAIIRRKAQLLDISIPDDVAEYIANRLKTNIRQLEGAVKKMKAYKLLQGTNPSIVIAQNAIRDILNDNQPVPVTVERIIAEVGRTYGISPQDIRSNKRSAQISSARQVAIYIVRDITQMSMATIGEEFGGRDHSTIVYALQQVEKNMNNDLRYKETIEDIIKNIRDS